MTTSDVIVVGSGVIGASIAYHLTLAGASVALVDQAGPAAMPSASWASAGGLRSQGRHAADAPLTIASAQRWPTLEAELGANLEASFGGHLHVAETEAGASVVERRIAEDMARGIAIERVEGAALRSLVSHASRSILMGAYTPGDGQAHPGRTAAAFARRAGQLGAVLRFGEAARLEDKDGRITGVRLAGGEHLKAGAVVAAAGAWSVAMLPALGIDLPLRWRGLQMLLSDVASPLLRPTLTAVGRNLSLKQSASGQLMVGGRWFARPSGAAPAVTSIDAHVAGQWSSAVAMLPAMAGLRLQQVWAGAEAQSIDGQPFIGPAGPQGLYIATGFSNHGFQISPGVGQLVAAELTGSPDPRLDPFRPARMNGVAAEAVQAFRDEPILLQEGAR